MPTETTTEQQTGKTGEQQDDPAKTGTTKTETTDEQLGAGGLNALRAERTAREKAERERDADRAELAALRAKHQTAEEKALEEAEKKGRESATLDANRRIVRSEIRASAGGKVADPDDAAALLGDLDRFIVKGEVDTKAISSAIDDLVKAKPYLAAAGSKATALRGGSATQTSGSDFNSELRRRIHGR